MRQFYVYIMTNRYRNVLYVGVTRDLRRRVWEHRTGAVAGFTKRYQVKKLVYYEAFSDSRTAIAREKQLKAGSRRKKVAFVEGANPEWRDLYFDL